MIKVSNVSKRFGGRRVLDGVSFVVNDGEVVGVVGPNGAGKSTLLRIIAGAETPDSGAARANGRIGYLQQGYVDGAARAVKDVFPHVFMTSDAASRLETLAARVSAAPHDAELAREYDGLVAEVARSRQADAGSFWRALALRHLAPDEPLGALSGGEQTKLGLIGLAASAPDLLLLDEPTNHLDLLALGWLDDYLRSFSGAIIMVSHDRALLDDHATSIVELDPSTGRGEVFRGNYSSYAAEKARRHADLWDRYRRQQERERRVRAEIRAIKQTATGHERMSQNDFYRRKAKKIARRAVVLERRLERELSSEQRLEKPVKRPYRVKAEITPATRAGDRMLAAQHVTIAIGGQECPPFTTRVLLADVSLEVAWSERIVLAGPNGSGKTTLLRALTGEHPLSSGTVRLSPSTRIGYLAQEERDADGSTTPVDIVRAASGSSETEARRFLHRFLFTGDGALTPVGRLSYGERRRLSLARLVIGGANLLLLDEPTNHLDIPSREAFEAALDAYEGAMLAVTHDRYFIERFAQRLLLIEGMRLRETVL
jgi:ATP-binding cassette subfamily F protein 3